MRQSEKGLKFTGLNWTIPTKNYLFNPKKNDFRII